MSAPSNDNKKQPAYRDIPAAPGGDWFYDELMTAQPDATREFYRQRLALIRAKIDKR